MYNTINYTGSGTSIPWNTSLNNTFDQATITLDLTAVNFTQGELQTNITKLEVAGGLVGYLNKLQLDQDTTGSRRIVIEEITSSPLTIADGQQVYYQGVIYENTSGAAITTSSVAADTPFSFHIDQGNFEPKFRLVDGVLPLLDTARSDMLQFTLLPDGTYLLAHTPNF